jgi:hypothetical protein
MSAAQVYQQEVSENDEALRCINREIVEALEKRGRHSSFVIPSSFGLIRFRLKI